FLSKICIEVFRETNNKYRVELTVHKRHHLFAHYYDQFCQSCLLVAHLLSYGKKIYLTYSVCNLIIIVFVLYSAMYANSNMFQQCIYIGYLGLNLFLINFLSHIIGLVDVEGKALSDQIYEEFFICCTNRYLKYFYWRILRYFQAAWSSKLSMQVMGSAINSATSIMVGLTVVCKDQCFSEPIHCFHCRS